MALAPAWPGAGVAAPPYPPQNPYPFIVWIGGGKSALTATFDYFRYAYFSKELRTIKRIECSLSGPAFFEENYLSGPVWPPLSTRPPATHILHEEIVAGGLSYSV